MRTLLRTATLLFLLLLGGVTAMRGQSALDGFASNTNGPVVVVVVQSDGKVLIGGNFTAITPEGGVPVTRNYIARLNPDGTLDTAFNPNVSGGLPTVVGSIALQADGKILVGGEFTSIGGQMRNRIARLDATTGAADSFNPNANGRLYAIAVQADGKILAGGDFQGANSIGGAARNWIARLDPMTGLADSFNPAPNSTVSAIVVQADGKIIVGGSFSGTIGGQTRNRIVRLDPTSGLADSFNPNANGGVESIAVQADGKILAGGGFTSIGGQTRNRIARLDSVTGLADSFNPNANNSVESIAVQADGRILAGGTFTSIGGQTRRFIARLDATTGLADSFNPNPNPNGNINSIAVQADGKILAGGSFQGTTGTLYNISRLETDGRLDHTPLNLDIAGDKDASVWATAVQEDGKILIGGNFSSVLGVMRNNIARLNTDGTLDMAFNPNANGRVFTVAVQADGKILAGGIFNGANSIGGQTRNYIARLDATTGLADSFNPNVTGTIVWAIAVQADGKILAGGRFSNIGGQVRNRIARLDPTTGLADSFNPNANDDVYTIAVQTDGKILAGGFFTHIGGQTRNRIARLDSTTGLADSFNPNASAYVTSIAVQTDGKILAGGGFTSIGGQLRNRIARLDNTGSADSFNPNANLTVHSIVVQEDGKILVGGEFNGANSIGGQTRNGIARLNGTTGLADSFDPGVAGQTYSIAVQTDGKILAGGHFGFIGGQLRNHFARLSNDTAALQNLAARQTTVTWMRDGSSPQLARATFESSTDNVSYTFLGNGTAVGSNWTLTGLSLPLGQDIYIRARGYYRGGYQNGSESLTESVRNAFITLPPTPTSVVSRKLHGGVSFDINLPLTGNAGIECRSGGASNDYQVVLTFPSAVSFNNAAITAAAGSVSGTSGSGTSTLTVNLTGVTSAQKITVTLFNLSDGTNTGDLGVQMGVLVGDPNGDGVVNSGDSQQTRNRSGQTTDATNFRFDVNADGSVNSGDVTVVRANSGTSLP